MVLFGEIVEPTTRAPWGDDLMEYPENIKTQLQWEKAITVPNKIENLIVIETKKLIEIVERCLPLPKVALNKLKEVDLAIYDIDASTYVILCHSSANRTYAEITEALKCWLKKSNNVVCLTSKPLVSYQNGCKINEKTTFIKHLSVKPITTNISSEVLKSPNLITGLVAGILTYSIVNGLNCVSFVVYLEMTMLDSINTKPVLDLLKWYCKSPIKQFKLLGRFPENNIYI